jgi:hypothetical protein
MIGRIDSNADLRQGRHQDGAPLRAVRLATLLAMAALIVIGGGSTSTSTLLAQTPGKPPAKPKARLKGI